MTTIRDVGERGLIARLAKFCPPGMIGDDAAILTQSSLVVTTDVLVDGVHFSDRTTSPKQVGWRSAAANLSDLAAMGATPLGITVGLALRSDVELAWVESLYQGLFNCLNSYHAPILGGDVCASEVNTVAITALGKVEGDRLIRRSAAQPGYAILVTGYHGASRAGLECLLQPEKAASIDSETLGRWQKAHQEPLPRLDVIPPLWEIAGDIPVAGMDSSDGLADAIYQICAASQVGATINWSHIPMVPYLQRFFPQEAANWTLYGGEDFELVLCLPRVKAEQLQEYLGYPAAIIGEITADLEISLENCPDASITTTINSEMSFQHFG